MTKKNFLNEVFVPFVVIIFMVLPFIRFMFFMVERFSIYICADLCSSVSHNRSYPPKAASSITTAASEQSSMASILPNVTGRTERMKNSAVLICPS